MSAACRTSASMMAIHMISDAAARVENRLGGAALGTCLPSPFQPPKLIRYAANAFQTF